MGSYVEMTRLDTPAPPGLHSDKLWPTVGKPDQMSTPSLPITLLRHIVNGIVDYASTNHSTSAGDSRELEEKVLLHLMDNATSLQQYQSCAETLDELQMNNEWKKEHSSDEPGYNPRIIEDHMKDLEYARSTSDLGAMQHLLRTTLSRDLGGMNSLALYKHSWAGTKNLIEDYIATVLETIEKFVNSAVEFKLESSEVQFYQQSLEDALKYFGRSALTLSGGAIMGMKHIGVVKALWETDLLPEVISGASAGSIVAAVVGVSNDEEMHGVVDVFPTADLACFDPADTSSIGWLMQRVLQFFHGGTFFSMDNMERVLYPWLGDMTFREAFYKTQRVLNICVSGAESGVSRLLNYVTAPDVLILSAVCASCSVPGVFPAAQIFEKDPVTKRKKIWMEHAKQLFVDGSLDHDIPTRKLSEMFNVNFFITSQVNPHVRMFLDAEQKFFGKSTQGFGWAPYGLSSIFGNTKHLIKQAILHRTQQLKDIGLGEVYLRWASLLSQKYTGDINILPQLRKEELTYMLANPSVEFMLQAVVDGERATWPKIYRVKNCVAIELALIRAINTLKTRVNFGPEARAAREANTRSGRGRSFSIRGQRPGFLRQRSLSIEHQTRRDSIIEMLQTSNPPTPGPSTQLRRNQSLGQLDTFSFSNFKGFISPRSQTPVTPPGVSLDHSLATGYFDGSLKMTSASSRSDDDIAALDSAES